MFTFIAPLVLIVSAAAIWIVLQHLARREREGELTAELTDDNPTTWTWPEWPVEREAGERQPHGRRYSAREKESA